MGKCGEKHLACVRAYRAAHLDVLRARDRDYRRIHKEEEQARIVLYREAHREKARLVAKAARAANPEKGKAYAKLYNKTHQEENLVRSRMYRKMHPGWSAAISARRRARQFGLLSTITADQVEAIKNAYQWRCSYCRRKFKTLTIDHVVPLAKGGSHTLANLVPACRSCNSKKHTSMPTVVPSVRLLL